MSTLQQLCLNSCTKFIENDLYLNLKTNYDGQPQQQIQSKRLIKLQFMPVHLIKSLVNKLEPFYLDLIEDYNLNLNTNFIWKYYFIKFKKYFYHLLPLSLQQQQQQQREQNYKKYFFELLANLWLMLSLRTGKRDHEIIFRLILLTKTIKNESAMLPSNDAYDDDDFILTSCIHPSSLIYELIFYRLKTKWYKYYVSKIYVNLNDYFKYYLINTNQLQYYEPTYQLIDSTISGDTLATTSSILNLKLNEIVRLLKFSQTKYETFLSSILLKQIFEYNSLNEIEINNDLSLIIKLETLLEIILFKKTDKILSFLKDIYLDWLKFLVNLFKSNKLCKISFNNFNQIELDYLLKSLDLNNVQMIQIKSNLRKYAYGFIDDYYFCRQQQTLDTNQYAFNAIRAFSLNGLNINFDFLEKINYLNCEELQLIDTNITTDKGFFCFLSSKNLLKLRSLIINNVKLSSSSSRESQTPTIYEIDYLNKFLAQSCPNLECLILENITWSTETCSAFIQLFNRLSQKKNLKILSLKNFNIMPPSSSPTSSPRNNINRFKLLNKFENLIYLNLSGCNGLAFDKRNRSSKSNKTNKYFFKILFNLTLFPNLKRLLLSNLNLNYHKSLTNLLIKNLTKSKLDALDLSNNNLDCKTKWDFAFEIEKLEHNQFKFVDLSDSSSLSNNREELNNFLETFVDVVIV